MRVSIIIPYRSDGDPWRAKGHAFIVEYFQNHFADCELIVGRCEADEWAKGAAVNDGVARASGDVLILNDADSFVSPQGLREALQFIEAGRQWVVPHGHVFRLTEEATQRVLAAPSVDDLPRDLAARVVRHPYMGPPGGGINVITRDAFDGVNGMDPRFTGWGGEDICFAKALTTMGFWHWRLDYKLWHLYHPHPAPDLRGTPEAEAMVARYNAADRKRDAMHELLFSR